MQNSDKPLVSVLVITEGRPEFMPWVAWQFNRLTWPRKELVVVASREDIESANLIRELVPPSDLILDTTMPAGASLGAKRNVAKAHARGEWLTWADDDDWCPADRIEKVWGIRRLYPERDMSKVTMIALMSHVPLLSLYNMRCQDRIRKWAWTSCLYEAEMAKSIPFLKMNTTEDGFWLDRFETLNLKASGQDYLIEAAIPNQIMCLHHGRNISVGRRNIDAKYWPMDFPDWLGGESVIQIEALRARLGLDQ